MRPTTYILILFLFVLSCTNNPPNNPDPDHRLKFIGTYNMTKLEDDSTYTMTIDTIGPWCSNANNCDSMKISNFCDLFDIKFIQPMTTPDYWLYWPFYNPITDKYGKRWHLTWGNGNVYAPNYYNAIYGDSIKISFEIDNILYYFADGVPYLDTIYTHVGKRN